MITDCYDETEPLIHLQNVYGEQKHIVDTCLIIFSDDILKHILETYDCMEIGCMRGCNGSTPIYKTEYKGKEVAFYLTNIGSSMASCNCLEVNWLTGATKFIMFGSCGSLDREKTDGKFIIPTEAYRGEGCSYYYAPPADYISIKNSDRLASIFAELKVPYVQGRVWTTDVMLRETRGLIAKRKAEGCIGVEMEVAGVQAACDYHGIELYDFLESGDVLEEEWDIEGLPGANDNLGKLYIAFEIAKRI